MSGLETKLHGLISTVVPTATRGQISSISSLVTAMQPSVQSFRRCAAPTKPNLAQAVDFDVATGADAELASVFPVLCIGLGEMKGAVEDTRGIFAVDDVESFGSFVIALALLRAHGLATEGDLVCSEHRTATHGRSVRLLFSMTMRSAGLGGTGVARMAKQERKRRMAAVKMRKANFVTRVA